MSKKSIGELSYDPSNLTSSELEQVIYNIEHPHKNGIVESDPGKAAAVHSLISGLLSAKLAEKARA
jgi:hypothetical protein